MEIGKRFALIALPVSAARAARCPLLSRVSRNVEHMRAGVSSALKHGVALLFDRCSWHHPIQPQAHRLPECRPHCARFCNRC